MTEINDDNVRLDQIKATYKVLEMLREQFKQFGMDSEADDVNTVHYHVQQYEANSEWRASRAVDNVDPDDHQTLDTFEPTGEIDVEQT